jgi:hydroxyproline transport system permease protein
MNGYHFYWSTVWASLPLMLAGAWVTIQLTFLAFIIGTLIAMPMAVARQEGGGWAYRLSTGWVELARNTPAIFQLFVVYFGLGAIHINIPSYAAVLISVSFNNAGYMTEIFRGGLSAIPQQQLSAARSLGMTRPQSFIHVIFPQMFKVIFLAYITQGIWGMLNTSLGMLVGLQDLTGVTQYAQSISFRTFEFFIVAAGMYYLIAKGLQISALLAFRLIYRS